MTNETLNDLEAMANAAVAGPWRAKFYRPPEAVSGGIWFIEHGPADDLTECYDLLEDMPETTAAFIAAARTAVPELISELRRLRQELETKG